MLAPPAHTLVSLLETRAAAQPSTVAYRFLKDAGGQVSLISYAQLALRARAIAATLRKSGAAGDRALLLHAPGLDYVAALFGCMYAGVIAVPAYPPKRGHLMQRLSAIAADADARWVLTDERSRSTAHALLEPNTQLARCQWLATDLIEDSASNDFAAPSINEATLALLQYTSGSTSAPKGVMVSHRNFLHNTFAIADALAMNERDCVVSWLPPYHDMGLVAGIMLPLCADVPGVLMAPLTFFRRPALWLEAISSYRGTISGGPNFSFELCARRVTEQQRSALDLSSWRVAFCGAERVHADTLRRFAETFADCGLDARALGPCYGLAETTLAVTLSPTVEPLTVSSVAAGHASQQLVACGVPLAGLQVNIVDPETLREQPAGKVGEIWVAGESVTRGYWRKPELDGEFAAHKQPDDGSRWLRTGDLGFLESGQLYVTGRIKDLIVLGGVNHYPDDIEAAVAGCHPQLGAMSAAFGVQHNEQERVVVVCEVASGRQRNFDEMMVAVREAVARNLSLALFEVVLVSAGGVPRTSSGKVQRRACKAMYQQTELTVLARSALEQTDTTPDANVDDEPSDTLATLQAMVAELLGLEQVRPHDDLFLLGGHSLLATQLVSRVRERLGRDLSLRMVFEASNLTALAARIDSAPPLPSAAPLTRLVRTGKLPLSFSQERMWFLHHLEPTGAAYNVAGALQIGGPLQLSALRQAFDELLVRHEVLRTNYPSHNGEAEAVVSARRSLLLPCHDLSRLPDPTQAAAQRASKLAHQPFDIARDALLRAELYRTGEQQHVLAVSLHHLVTDGWSMGIMVRDLLTFYDAIRTQTALPAQADAPSYLDYADWQRRSHAAGEQQNQLVYWRKQLAGVPPLELPTDFPREGRQSSEGALEPLPLSSELLGDLRRVAAEQGATLFMVMLAAFDLALHRYTGQSDVVVGVPVANRNRLSAEPFIGSLVNTLPVRVQLGPRMTLRELLREVREASLEAFAHQDLPFERLIAELATERHAGRSPLVQVMFDFQNSPMPSSQTETLSLQPLVLSRGASQFDLSLLILDSELGKTAGVEYRTDLFHPETIRRFLSHYTRVLRAFVDTPDLPVEQVRLLDEHERRRVIALGRAPKLPVREHTPVHRRIERQVQLWPEEVAVSDAAGELTYAALEQRAAQLGYALAARGATPGARVAIYLERSAQLVVAMYAVLKTGAAYVPLDPLYPPARLSLVLSDCEPSVVVTQRSLLSTLTPSMAARALLIENVAWNGPVPDNDRINAVPASPEAAVYILYTSGSTGRPKGVEVSDAALDNFLCSMARSPGMTRGDCILAITTAAFDIAGLELLLPLICGARTHVAPSELLADGRLLIGLLESVRPTHLQATPATWRLLLEAGLRRQPDLKILCGGEGLPRELADRLLSVGSQVWNVYGPTETTIWSTLQRVERGVGPVAIGVPIDRTNLYVLDTFGQPSPVGVPGELYIGGAGVANGYFGRPDLTAERFVPDPFVEDLQARMYRTGDQARVRADGVFFCMGRLDNQIKIRGYRVEPSEIEAVLKEECAARDAVVVAREARPGDLRLIGYYVPSGDALPGSVLRERLRGRLPEYMVPSVLVSLSALPQTPNGKVDRAALPAPDLSLQAERPYVAPRSSTEQTLANCWAELLGIDNPSVDESFFQLGGHSLLAVRMFSQIERELGAALPLAALLEGPSIAQLAARVDSELASQRNESAGHISQTPASAKHLVQVRAGGRKAPFFCVHGAGGHVLNMVPIAQHLGGDRPFYGLAARGVDGVAQPHDSIRAMAVAYLAEIRSVQPHGPYYLGGYCGGGLVAYEMALLLLAEGETVALLALIDTYHPQVDVREPRGAKLRQGLAESGLSYLAMRARARLSRTLTRVVAHTEIGLARARTLPIPMQLRDFWLTTAFFEATRKYRPAPYPGLLTVLHAEQARLLRGVGADLGWKSLAGSLSTLSTPGNHDTLALAPNVSALAATLGQCLSEAERLVDAAHDSGVVEGQLVRKVRSAHPHAAGSAQPGKKPQATRTGGQGKP